MENNRPKPEPRDDEDTSEILKKRRKQAEKDIYGEEWPGDDKVKK